MKFGRIFYLILAVFVCGVFSSCRGIQVKKRNLENLQHLHKGMTKSEVLKVMGEPLKNEVYNTDDVWYYFTQTKWSDGMITRDECTPLFFNEDGLLLGWGQKAYKEYLQKKW